MNISRQGLLEIISHEAVVRSPYYDNARPPRLTFGVGHTKAAGGINPHNLDKSKRYAYKFIFDIFKSDIKKYVKRVNDVLKVPVSQHQFDALVSFEYNTEGLAESTALKYINAGKSNLFIGPALMMWIRSGGKINKGLVNRRRQEVRLFITGHYSNNGTALEYQTNGKGRLIWSGAERVNVEKYI